jgi:hypothetical protein
MNTWANLHLLGQPNNFFAAPALRRGPGRLGAVKRPQRFPMEIHFVPGFCVGLLYGRAGRLNTKTAGFRPLVPPPVWSTIYYCKMLLVPV